MKKYTHFMLIIFGRFILFFATLLLMLAIRPAYSVVQNQKNILITTTNDTNIIHHKDSLVTAPISKAETKDHWIKNIATIVTLIIGFGAFIITIMKFYFERKKEKGNNKKDLRTHLEKARILMGGEYGIIGIPMHVVGSREESQNLEKAHGEILNASSIDKKNAAVLYHEGLYLLKRGRLEKAFKMFRKAVKKDPCYAPAHNGLGMAHRAKGELEKAIQHYKESIRIDSDYLLAYINLGNALCEQNKLDEAKKAYQKAISIDDSSCLAYIGIGNVCSGQNNHEEAINAYRRAASYDPQNGLPLIGLAGCLMSQGKIKEAIENYHAALEINPNNAYIYIGFGNLLQIHGKSKKANKIYSDAIEHHSNDPCFYMSLGDYFSHYNLKMEAMWAYQKAIKLQSNYSEISQKLTSLPLIQNTTAKAVIKLLDSAFDLGLKAELKQKALIAEAIEIFEVHWTSVLLSVQRKDILYYSDEKIYVTTLPDLKLLEKVIDKYQWNMRILKNSLRRVVRTSMHDMGQIKVYRRY